MKCDILITNIKALVQVREQSLTTIAGEAMQKLPCIENAFLSIHGGLIQSFGRMEELPQFEPRQQIDATDKFVFPSFVDSHTHLVFAATREDEFVQKLKGASYKEIAAKGGGILNSARKLRAMSEEELLDLALERASKVIRSGTGAIEIKSGYGLTVKDELKMLRVAKSLGRLTNLTVKTTLLGAHAVPENITKQAYIDLIINEMIPAAAEEKLADYVDVFCEDGFYSIQETIRIVECGKSFGLRPRIHANQLARSGGVEAGVRTGAVSVDHLENIGDEELALLQRSNVIPTALPWAAFFLSLPFPPVRKMISAGLAVAIASDYNPGSSPNSNMLQVLSLSCIGMKMTPEEAINAATVNTAAALEISGTHGSITRGKVANLFVTRQIPSIAYIPYTFGSDIIETTILKGEIQ